ncbi:PREDICTED: histone-lysine N-methyltransferase ATXR5 [Tarenaya hassleriana]|uniref:histone-lysine N-methyltransferase ATXR5 n=1 Tax=Tarenaya hassleriana TaxID=28532 RepID=UPI00053C4EF3|nr:PREDICTED: histone-lysine N-methyltransferase ATXR5 [Tarenaya hassleriana]
MATAISSPAASPRRFVSSRRRTEAPHRFSSDSPPRRKMKSMADIMANARYATTERDSYSDVTCEKCGSGEGDEELLLCDKCDRGFHMKCLRPIVARVPSGPWVCHDCSDKRRARSFSQKKILDFFRIEKRIDHQDKWEHAQDAKKYRRRSAPLVMKKRRRRLLPFVPSEDPSQRLKQMGTLASALTALRIEYSDDLTYESGMALRSANQSKFEKGGMQVLPKEDLETLEQCRAMCRRGECPPLVVMFDPIEGYTVEADGPIKDLTFIAEYTGDVDYLKNRENDDCDSIMTLLLAENPLKSLVICPDKYANISRFINGINNHTPGGKKKQNCKCVRYSINGECRVLIVANRDIAKGERLYYDYNGYEHEYPTHNFI